MHRIAKHFETMADSLIKTPTPGPDQALLEPFVGIWNTTGVIKGADAMPDLPINGTDVYEWLPGGFFLLHRVDVFLGEARAQSIEIIGFDPGLGQYTLHSFDHQGHTALMHATVQNGVWTFKGTTMRFTGQFSADGDTITGIWEQAIDGQHWTHWMDIQLTRVPG